MSTENPFEQQLKHLELEHTLRNALITTASMSKVLDLCEQLRPAPDVYTSAVEQTSETVAELIYKYMHKDLANYSLSALASSDNKQRYRDLVSALASLHARCKSEKAKLIAESN